MLELSTIDLGDVADALGDQSEFGTAWWIDADTGEVWIWSDELELPDEDDPSLRRDARRIEPISSRVAYRDMQDFVAGVQDRRAADLLDRAIDGRGAFRRFKDTLVEFPELRQAWFEFRDRRARRRAIEFLAGEGLVDHDDASRAIDALD